MGDQRRLSISLQHVDDTPSILEPYYIYRVYDSNIERILTKTYARLVVGAGDIADPDTDPLLIHITKVQPGLIDTVLGDNGPTVQAVWHGSTWHVIDDCKLDILELVSGIDRKMVQALHNNIKDSKLWLKSLISQ